MNTHCKWSQIESENKDALDLFRKSAYEAIKILNWLEVIVIDITNDDISKIVDNTWNQYESVTKIIEEALFSILDRYTEGLDDLTAPIWTWISEIISLILLQKMFGISDRLVIFLLLKTMSNWVSWSSINRISHIVYKVIEEKYIDTTKDEIESTLRESTRIKYFESYQWCPMLDLWKENVKWIEEMLKLIKEKIVLRVDTTLLESWFNTPKILMLLHEYFPEKD